MSRINKRFPILCIAILQMATGCAQNKGEHSTEHGVHGQTKNRLAKAKSPYLQQHADNPVDWYEWGDEALEKAKREDKPLIISIGYSACHWCHVMEHQSFMDTAVARVMNDNFVSIKVDREERPDIDHIYLDAAQLLNGRGGWPLNAFALPDGRPFYAGTYFPKAQWLSLLKQVAKAYATDKARLTEQAASLSRGIAEHEVINTPPDTTRTFTRKEYDALFSSWQKSVDYRLGGWGRTPKFPLPIGWEFALQTHYLTGNDRALEAVRTTLDHMQRGGINDQLGGGFARYSTDDRWLVPHFEKMLYDNAQLVKLYAHAYQVTGDESYAATVRHTLRWVAREMTSPRGGFYSSINADSEGEEGKYYVWTLGQLQKAVDPPTAELLAEYYDVKAKGNWENGKNVLHRPKGDTDFPAAHDLDSARWAHTLKDAKAAMLAARELRVRPSLDDKVLTAWNALMIEGYVAAYRALGDGVYLDAAVRNAGFLWQNMHRKDGGLWRNYHGGQAGIHAFLDDYAALAQAYVALYQVTFDVTWLQRAEELAEYAIAHFRDARSGMFYTTEAGRSDLIARKMEIADNVVPSSNSMMATVLYQLGLYQYNPIYTRIAEDMLAHTADNISSGGPYYANWAMLAGNIAYGEVEVAITGPRFAALRDNMLRHYLPTTLFMGGQSENLPLLENKVLPGANMIYVCRDKVCELPVSDPAKALEQLVRQSGQNPNR